MQGSKKRKHPLKEVDGRFNEDRNANWQRNEAAIIDATKHLIGTLKRMPTNDEIAKHAKLHSNTVANHNRGREWGDYKDQLRSLTSQVLTGNAMAAIAGRARNVQLHMYYVENVPLKHTFDARVEKGDQKKRVNIYLPDNGRGSETA